MRRYSLQLVTGSCPLALALVMLMICFGLPSVHAGDDGEQSRRSVVVGGYQFEPFVEDEGGVSPNFAAMLNEAQTEFLFEFIHIPAKRRYEQLADGKIDMMFFEMPVWGWAEVASHVDTSAPILSGREFFVSRVGHKLGDTVFRDLNERRIAITFGYHYAFLGFNAEPEQIRSRYDVVFANQQRFTLRHMLMGNADVAIVNDAFLRRSIDENPKLADRLMVSPFGDQRYELPIMLRKGGPVSLDALRTLLARLSADGTLKSFFDREGLGDSLIYP